MSFSSLEILKIMHSSKCNLWPKQAQFCAETAYKWWCFNQKSLFRRQCKPCALTCRQSLHLLQSSSCTTTSTLSINPWFRELRYAPTLLVILRNPESPRRKQLGRKKRRAEFPWRTPRWRCTGSLLTSFQSVHVRVGTSPALGSGVTPDVCFVCVCGAGRTLPGGERTHTHTHSSPSLSSPHKFSQRSNQHCRQ